MNKPTGKLAFAYATITRLEARIAELESAQPVTEACQGWQDVLRQCIEVIECAHHEDGDAAEAAIVAGRAALASKPTEPLTRNEISGLMDKHALYRVHLENVMALVRDVEGEHGVRAALATQPNGVMAAQDAETWTDEDVDNLCWSAFESGMAGGMSVDSFRWLANSLRLKRLPARAARTRGADGSGL